MHEGTKYQIFVEKDGLYRTFFRLHLSKNDLSFYIFPPKLNGKYLAKNCEFKSGETTLTLKPDEKDTRGPHMSFHKSGTVHIKDHADYITEPISIGPLVQLKGQNIAVIQPFSLESLPKTSPPNLEAEENLIITTTENNLLASIWVASFLTKSAFQPHRQVHSIPHGILEIGIKTKPLPILSDKPSVILLGGFTESARDLNNPGAFLQLTSA